MSPNDIAGLCERLKREVPSGRYTIGSGSLSSDGKFSGTPSLPIMTLVNPDGPEAATALAELSAKLDAQEGVADRAHSELAKADEALTTASARIAELEGALGIAGSWLERWAQHVGNCPVGRECTCGLTRIRYDIDAALERKP